MSALDPRARVKAQREALWQAGYRPVPIYNHDARCNAPGKQPVGGAWQDRARRNPPEAASMEAETHAMNTGILCDGLRAVDVDIDDADLAGRVRQAALDTLGVAIMRTRANSGRCLLLYRAAEGEPGKRHIAGNAGKVEVLGRGQQFVAYGLHTSGTALAWDLDPENATRDRLTAVTEDQVTAFLAAVAPLIGAAAPVAAKQGELAPLPRTSSRGQAADPLAVAAALARIPNDGPPDWDAWNRVGMALWAAMDGSELGRETWDAWSAKNDAYDPAETAERWAHYRRSPPREIGAGTLFHLARQGRARARELPALFPEPTTPAMLRLLSPDDCAEAPRRGYVVKGLIAPGDLACIFGPPGAGKSVLAPHLAYAVAQGCEVFGRRVRPGAVFYVGAEDQSGLRQRVHALRLQRGPAPELQVVEGVSDLFNPETGQADALRALVAEHTPALIVLDTVAAAFPGMDENTSQDMGRVVAFARELAAHGAAVMLIHHDSKARDGTPRGHSILNGALDVAIQLDPRDGEGVIRGKLAKNRNGPCDGALAFRITAPVIGQDEDGDAITAPLAAELDKAEAAQRGPRVSPTEKRALDVLRDLVAINAGEPVSDGAWRERCESERLSTSDNPDNRVKVINRTMKALLDKGLVVARGGLCQPSYKGCELPPVGDAVNCLEPSEPGRTAQEPGGTNMEPTNRTPKLLGTNRTDPLESVPVPSSAPTPEKGGLIA